MQASSRKPHGQLTPRPFAVEAALERHRRHAARGPRTAHGLIAFEQIDRARQAHGGRLVLDVGCGTGESTHALASRFPDALVIGVDKSAHRLARALSGTAPNLRLVRAEAGELWSRAAEAGWTIDDCYLLYPNPWPKPRQLRRRFYGRPAFLDLLAIARRIEARTNWEVYARELTHALERGGWRPRMRAIAAPEGLTAFERKYAASQHRLWSVVATPTQG